MRKQFISTLLVCALLTSGSAAAKDVFETLHVPPPSEETNLLLRLAVAGAMGVGFHQSSKYMNLKDDTTYMLHAAHGMVQLGQTFSSPAAMRMGVNMAMTTVAAGVATTDYAKSWIKMLPIIGANMELAGSKAIPHVTGWLNDIFQYVYGASVGQTRVGKALGLYDHPCQECHQH